jgi:hypothetical protein
LRAFKLDFIRGFAFSYPFCSDKPLASITPPLRGFRFSFYSSNNSHFNPFQGVSKLLKRIISQNSVIWLQSDRFAEIYNLKVLIVPPGDTSFLQSVCKYLNDQISLPLLMLTKEWQNTYKAQLSFKVFCTSQLLSGGVLLWIIFKNFMNRDFLKVVLLYKKSVLLSQVTENP